MKNRAKLKTSFFASIALLITLGFIVAGFVWLHIEPGKTKLHHQTLASLHDAVTTLQAQMTQQQQLLLDLQAKIHKLEIFEMHMKALH
jgi:hypothetical protein